MSSGTQPRPENSRQGVQPGRLLPQERKREGIFSGIATFIRCHFGPRFVWDCELFSNRRIFSRLSFGKCKSSKADSETLSRTITGSPLVVPKSTPARRNPCMSSNTIAGRKSGCSSLRRTLRNSSPWACRTYNPHDGNSPNMENSG